MNPKLKSFLKIVLPLGFGIFLIYMFYNQLSEEDLLEMEVAVKNANYGFLVLSVSCTGLSQIIRAFRWRDLLKAAGCDITAFKAFNAISINYFVNLGIPRAGEIARCGVLATYDGIPVNRSIGTLVNERIIDVLMLLFIGLLSFVFQYQIFMDFYQEYLASVIADMLSWFFSHPILTICLVVLSLVGFGLGINFLRKTGKNEEGKFKKIISGFKDGILSIFKLENPVLFILQTVLIWVGYLFMIFFAFKTVNLGVIVGFGAVLSLLFFGTFGFLATPGGIGAYPLIAGYLLVLYGVQLHIGSTMGWVLWIGQTALIIILGLFAFAALSREKNLNLQILGDESEAHD